MQAFNYYLTSPNYEKLQEILKEKKDSTEYILSDYLDIRNKVNKKYDVIILSNISDGITDVWNVNALKCFKRYIHSLSKILNPGGIIQVGYIYDYYFSRPNSLFASTLKREKVFTSPEFTTEIIDSYRFKEGNDAVVLYRK